MFNRVGMANYATPYAARNSKPAFQGVQKTLTEAEKKLLAKELESNPKLRQLTDTLYEQALHHMPSKFIDTLKLAKKAKAILEAQAKNPAKNFRDWLDR